MILMNNYLYYYCCLSCIILVVNYNLVNGQTWYVEEIAEINNPFNPPQASGPSEGYSTTVLNDDGVVVRILPLQNSASEQQNIKITVIPPEAQPYQPYETDANVFSFIVPEETGEAEAAEHYEYLEPQPLAAKPAPIARSEPAETKERQSPVNNPQRATWRQLWSRRPAAPYSISQNEQQGANRPFQWNRGAGFGGLSLLNRYVQQVSSPRNFRLRNTAAAKSKSQVQFRQDSKPSVLRVERTETKPGSKTISAASIFKGKQFPETFSNKKAHAPEDGLDIDVYFPEKRVYLPRHDNPPAHSFASTAPFKKPQQFVETAPPQQTPISLRVAPPPVVQPTARPKPAKAPRKVKAAASVQPDADPAAKKARAEAIKRQRRCGLPPFYKPCLSKSEANAFALDCCQKNSKIPKTCHRLCNIDVTPAQLWAADRSKTCPAKTVQPFLSCIAEEEDLRQCCQTKGVPSLCHTFCNPTQFEGFNMSQLRCLPYWNQIVSCFWGNADPR